MRSVPCVSIVAALVLQCGAAAVSQAAITITQSTSAPTYANVITFDEVGGPTGTVPGNSWVSMGVTEIAAGVGPNDGFVGNPPGFDTGNAYSGFFGVFITFPQPITSLSIQWRDDSPAASPFGGGAAIVAKDAMGNELQSLFLSNPSTTTSTWFNIVSTDGSSFSQLACLGFGNFPNSTIDNLSWAIPAPGTAALLGLGGLCAARRRRN